MGVVDAISLDSGGCTLTISDAGPVLGDCRVGDSIAVNGACLTVTRFDTQQKGGWFEVWLANETLERTDSGTRCAIGTPKALTHDHQESGRSATWSTWSVPWVPMSGSEDTLYKSVGASPIPACVHVLRICTRAGSR
jgi:hypothetical protein